MTNALPAAMDSLFPLWEDMAAHPAGETDAALKGLMRWISLAIDADNVVWMGAVRVLKGAEARREPFRGWRLRMRCTLRAESAAYRKLLASYLDSEHYGRLTAGYYRRAHEDWKDAHIGMASRAFVAEAGRFRMHRMRDGWIDFPAFAKTAHYQLYYENLGIADRIWVGVPVNGISESVFLIDRIRKRGKAPHARFRPEEAELAAAAIRGVPEFHRRLFLENGLLAGEKPLSPMQRQILRGLLTGRSEKEIAADVGQMATTTHKHVTGLYAVFRVTSRAALMALWLGRK